MNEQTRKALELARDWFDDDNNKVRVSDVLAAIDAAMSALDLNLSDRAVQKRLAAQWGYVPAPAAPAAQGEPCRFPGCQFTGCPAADCYDTTSPAPVAQPLTDEQIDAAFRAAGFRIITPEEVQTARRSARAIERAHGIGQGGAA